MTLFFTVMMFIGEGAGFKIQELSPLELITAVEGALSTFRSEAPWEKLIKNGMKQEFF